MKNSVASTNVDVFRAILAQWVILDHVCPEVFGVPGVPGRTPVLAFFVVSGYLNYLSFHRRLELTDWKRAIASYFLGRARRLYPLLIVSYVFVGVTIGSVIHADWITLFPFDLFVRERMHNGVLWTLVVELQLYLLTPLLFLAVPHLHGFRPIVSATLFAGFLGTAIPVAIALGFGDRTLVDDRSILSALPLYWFGMVIARSQPNYETFPKWAVNCLWLSVLLGCVYLIVTFNVGIRGGSALVEGRIVPVIASLMFLAAPTVLLNSAILARLGTLTYEIYLFHGLGVFAWIHYADRSPNVAVVLLFFWILPMIVSFMWEKITSLFVLSMKKPRTSARPGASS